MGVQPLHGKGPHPLLWTGSRAARGRIISGVSNSINYSVIFTVYIYLQTWPGRIIQSHGAAVWRPTLLQKKRFYEIVHSDRVVGGV
jgi:hypothetical protein